MYALVIDYMNFQATLSVGKTVASVPLAPENELSSPSLKVERASPLCESEWRSFFNSDGRILNESCLRKAIFKGLYYIIVCINFIRKQTQYWPHNIKNCFEIKIHIVKYRLILIR